MVFTDFYRPQRSWGKVMFLQASLILLTGGWRSASVHAGIAPPGNRHPLEQTPTPQEQTPPRTDTPQSRHPPQEQTPPSGADIPPGADTTPQSRACWEIWSTRGWYASYWNANLFLSKLHIKKSKYLNPNRKELLSY